MRRKPQYFFRSEAFPNDELEVHAFSGTEGISELYAYEIDLVSRRLDLTFEQLIDKPAVLQIDGAVESRFVHGIVTCFAQAGLSSRHGFYRATLAPPHVRLGLRQRLRIYQHKSTREIVTEVMKEAGLDRGLEWRLGASYSPRSYCVQHRETDLAFVQRLLEEDGVAFHFGHDVSGLKLILTDDNSALETIAAPSSIPFHPPQGVQVDVEHVNSFILGQRMTMDRVHLRDYSFKRPSAKMEARAQAQAQARARARARAQAQATRRTYELYEYPGEFVETELGDRLAGVRLEEIMAVRQTGHGKSGCRRLVAGMRFALEQHPIDELNQEYLVLRLSAHGTQPQARDEEQAGGDVTYGNELEVIPASVPFRPPRRTERPVVLGVHPARVVGPEGEEVYVDSHGRVKVQFPWDREGTSNERSSCWVRVAQPWAGSGYGALFLPRVGHEVVVAFLEGDPDRPIVVGCVYNGRNLQPCPLTASKTVSTIKSSSSPGGGGFNELRFEDRRGGEEVFLHAQRDYSLEVKNNLTEQVERDQSLRVGNDRLLEVRNRSEHRARAIHLEAAETLTFKVGTTFIEITPAEIKAFSNGQLKTASVAITEIKGAMVKINS